MAGKIVIRAHAKINLTLRVLGLRADGYHDLQTIFQSVALHDTLTISAARGPFRLECDDPSCPADESNLVWRAAAGLWSAARRRGAPGLPSGVIVRLAKRIPMQAGLGGGSSDAAAALLALARMWRVGFARVREVAASIGADVPYFLEGGTALGLDRGDVIVPLPDIQPAWITIAVPNFGVSTRDAFAAWDRSSRARGLGSSRGGTFNDLQSIVVRQHPSIGRVVAALQRAGAQHAAMSGSGSAVFGLFSRQADARAAARTLAPNERAERPGVGRVVVTRTVARAAYQRLAGIGDRVR